MQIEKIGFRKFKKSVKGKAGIVLLGLGGDLNNWVDDITEIMTKKGIFQGTTSDEIWENVYQLTTTGGRTDLAFVFGKKEENTGKLVVWRELLYAVIGCCWIPDYIENFAEQHIERENYDCLVSKPPHQCTKQEKAMIREMERGHEKRQRILKKESRVLEVEIDDVEGYTLYTPFLSTGRIYDKDCKVIGDWRKMGPDKIQFYDKNGHKRGYAKFNLTGEEISFEFFDDFEMEVGSENTEGNC